MNDFRWENGEKITLTDEEQSELEERQVAKAAWIASEGYKYKRAKEYPCTGEQFDKLFHDMTAGKGDKTGEWYKAINKVKTDNPK